MSAIKYLQTMIANFLLALLKDIEKNSITRVIQRRVLPQITYYYPQLNKLFK